MVRDISREPCYVLTIYICLVNDYTSTNAPILVYVSVVYMQTR